MSQEVPGRTKIVTGKTNSIHSTDGMNDRLVNNNPFMPDVPLHPDLLLRPPKQQPIKQNITQNIQEINPNPNISLDFEENSPFQEGIMSETFQRLDKSFFQNLKELADLINKEYLIHKYLPKQTDIDKILEVIQRKVLKGTHLPMEVKAIQVGYLCSPYFKDGISVSFTKQTPIFTISCQKIGNTHRKICLTGFITVQNFSRKRDSSSSNTRDVCRQNYNIIS